MLVDGLGHELVIVLANVILDVLRLDRWPTGQRLCLDLATEHIDHPGNVEGY